MGLEETLVIVKPDGMDRLFEILERFKGKGLTYVEGYRVRATRSIVQEHYAEVAERLRQAGKHQVLEALIGYMTSADILPTLWMGDNAVEVARELGGEKSDPPLCPPGTIRRDFSIDTMAAANAENRAVKNVVHTSDSWKAAEKEIKLWFPRRHTYIQKETGLLLPRPYTV